MIKKDCYECGKKSPDLMVSWGLSHVILHTKCLKQFGDKNPSVSGHHLLTIEDIKEFKDPIFAYLPEMVPFGKNVYKVGCKKCGYEELTMEVRDWKGQKCFTKK